MSKGNILNDISKGLYDLAIFEIMEIKKDKPHLSNNCDSLICICENAKNGIKPKKSEYYPLINKIIS